MTTIYCIYLLKPAAMHIGLVDIPGGRKTHSQAVPLIGGIAIFVGYSFSLLCLNISLSHYRGLLAGSAVLILIGVMDDFRELTPRIRLAGQCLVAFLLIEWGHLSLLHLGNLFFLGDVNLGLASLMITVFFVLGFINAINMIDGHDGLAGLIVVGQASLLMLMNVIFGRVQHVYLLSLLIATLCAFLLFNLPLFFKKRATIFLGDAGSTFIGFVIVWFAIDLSQVTVSHFNAHFHFTPVTVLWILAYPLFDLLAVIAHRFRIGKSPFTGGRDHLHHMLLDLGLRSMTVTIVLFIFSLSLGLMGFFLASQQLSEPWQCMIFSVVLLVYFFIAFALQRFLFFREKLMSNRSA